MKILLDENIPIKLKDNLGENEVFTVRYMNWNSVKNGALLKLAIENSFDIFITSDKNLQYQQNIKNIRITIIILDVLLLKWSFIQPLIPKIIELLTNYEKDKVYVLN